MCQKTGEETRQEESGGDGGEKEGTLNFLGDVKVKVFRLSSFTFSLVWLFIVWFSSSSSINNQ